MEPQSPPPVPPRIQPMIVHYELDRRDVFGCRLWVLVHNRFIVIFCAAMCLVGPLMSLGRPDVAPRSLPYKAAYFLTYAVFMFCAMAALQVLVMGLLLLIRKNNGVVGKHELTVRDDGLAQRTNVSEILHRWEGFQKVIPTPGFIFVYTTENNVEYVPRRAFASSQEAKRFEEELISRVKRTQRKG